MSEQLQRGKTSYPNNVDRSFMFDYITHNIKQE